MILKQVSDNQVENLAAHTLRTLWASGVIQHCHARSDDQGRIQDFRKGGSFICKAAAKGSAQRCIA